MAPMKNGGSPNLSSTILPLCVRFSSEACVELCISYYSSILLIITRCTSAICAHVLAAPCIDAVPATSSLPDSPVMVMSPQAGPVGVSVHANLATAAAKSCACECSIPDPLSLPAQELCFYAISKTWHQRTVMYVVIHVQARLAAENLDVYHV